MNLYVWNIAESCSEQEVRDFLEHELGHYAKHVSVSDSGTPRAIATVALNAEVPYIGEVIARLVQGKHLGGVALAAGAELFGAEPSGE
ncbi:RNA-binding protein [Paraburkholderia sp.]|uniref:RNA-binding protein n=1 Tax=Paraburkholderia sp. TaxID=1926495 RepID=UPI0023970E1F|nr:RNA-binding protein [Paraburkholderia sp.]MDE1181113.1 RNA-binding protein [Paraburkholderia sp.]